MSADENETEKHLWMGPAFFVSVLVAIIVFYVWLLGA
jgi:hypothetical protein